VPIAPDTLPDNPAALKQIIAAMAQDALTAEAEIARLKFQLARYRRAEFGRSSEKLARDTAQLELAIETLETDQAERLATASPAVAVAVEIAAEAQKPARRPLPEHLPREELRHSAPCTCPSCGGALRKIGDVVTETLDYVPGRFKVIRHIREKLSCRACDTVVAALAPDHAIARGRAGAARSHRRFQVRRPPAALPPGRNLRPRRGEPGNLDPVRLGRGDGGGGETARRCPRHRRPRRGRLAC
jgi:transposase